MWGIFFFKTGKFLLKRWTVFVMRFTYPDVTTTNHNIISLIAEKLTVHRIVALVIGSYPFWVRRMRSCNRGYESVLKTRGSPGSCLAEGHKPRQHLYLQHLEWRGCFKVSICNSISVSWPLSPTFHFIDHHEIEFGKAYEKSNSRADFRDNSTMSFQAT